jgi:hypothetical protein
MRKNSLSIMKICLALLAVISLMALSMKAQSTGTTSTNKPIEADPAPSPPLRLGYHGKISAVDTENMILTLASRTGEFKVKISPMTRISKDRQSGTFADAVEGLEATGQGRKSADGTWDAATLLLTSSQRHQVPIPQP